MMKEMLKGLIGKEIQVWPTDTYSKFGTLEDVGSEGILVKIDGVKSCDPLWKETGKLIFIAYSHNLTFKEV